MKPTVASLSLALAFLSCAPPAREHAQAPNALDAGAEIRDGGVSDDEPDAGRDAGLDDHPDAGVQQAMTLTVNGAQLTLEDGTAVEVRGAISCCGGGYGWPLFDDAWSALAKANDGNFLHARLGPFLTSQNGETDWADVGGGYVEIDGRADLDQFNEVFWARVRQLVQLARARTQYVEIDVIDGWGIKHCQAGDIAGYSAWDAAFNVQAVDACAAAGGSAVSPLHERWIRKVVAETGGFDNVLYQDGNEIGLVAGYSPEWTRAMHDIIRDEEGARGYPRHLFATNSGSAEAMELAEVDYLEFHQPDALTAAACHGKPCMVNEYNPSPALTPAQFGERLCVARNRGTGFWYWRHEQDDEQMHASLALLAEECPTVTSLAFPQGVPEEGFIATAAAYDDTDPTVDSAVNEAMAALTGCGVSTSCDLTGLEGATADEQCQSWFAAVTAELRANGFNAGQHEVGATDEIAVNNSGCEGKWYGYHVCNYGGPLVVWNPGARRGWWRIDPSYCP